MVALSKLLFPVEVEVTRLKLKRKFETPYVKFEVG
jgi:hypothetical protein